MSLFTEVYLSLPLPETFIYKIPEHLENEAETGKRVLVPFGKRKVTGYIKTILTQKPDSDFEIKDVAEVLDKIPFFSNKLLKLFEWISSYYIYPPGLVIKSALPSGINPETVKTVMITPEGKERIKSLKNEKYLKILNQIKDKPVYEKDICNDEINYKDINNLKNKGLVEIKNVIPAPKTKEKYEKFIVRTPGFHSVNLTEKQAMVLEKIPFKNEILKKDITSSVKGASSVINSLIKKGFVKESEKRVLRDPLGETVVTDTPPVLNDEQKAAVDEIEPSTGKEFKRFLLYGITGSGKTEVYLRLVQQALDMNKTAIVLVPEISLISQTEKRFKQRFKDKTAVIHSNLSAGEKLDQWTLIAQKEKQVVIGARSAIFAPLENIGIIIVDEEHDQSYKQDSSPVYNARDMAVVRAGIENCPVVLGSATPSVETYTNALNNKFKMLYLKKRVNNSVLPEVIVHDLKKSAKDKGVYKVISYYLASEIVKALGRNEQVLLFLNRRGFSSFVLCNICGEGVKCSYCSVTMTYHKSDESLVCHLCGYKTEVPVECPDCGGPNLVHLGTGTEKIEKACEFLFRDASTIRLDQDTTSKKGELIRKLKQIRNKEADIIIGTQMIAKGHDFPDITLVGIINADHGFNFPDFRAAEKTFQVLSQVSGRAGRGEKKGEVVMQTYNPDHFSIQTAKTQNFINFYDHEISFRKSLLYPPFSRLALIKISGPDENKAENFAKKCKNRITEIKNSHDPKTLIMGPAQAPIYKAASRFRFQILLKSETHKYLNMMLRELKNEFSSLPDDLRMTFDIDPYSMM
ncbi:MAG: primosomal protein N' [Thermodesulfobacteriota bacterium]